MALHSSSIAWHHRSFYWMTDASPSPIPSFSPLDSLFLLDDGCVTISHSVFLSAGRHPKPVVLQQSLFLLDDGCVTISRSLSLSAAHQLKPVIRQQSLFLLDDGCVTISHSLSLSTAHQLKPVIRQQSLFLLDDGCVTISHSMTDASQSPVQSLFRRRPAQAYRLTAVALSTGLRMRLPFQVSYRPTHVTPSYTLFPFLSLYIYRPTHVPPSYTLFPFLSLYLSSDPCHSFIYPFPFSLLIFIVRPMSLLHIPFSPFSLFSDIYLFFKASSPAPLLHSAPDAGSAYTHSLTTVYSQLYTQPIPLFRLLLCPGRRKGLHPVPFAHYGLHAAPYPAYFIISTSSPHPHIA
ncbi:hypothetical protein EDB19DRAFT_1902823 [Suillus lakei]|nr:hypothetical protein EDB19DRAFT_1902823 [Suillus lakei]